MSTAYVVTIPASSEPIGLEEALSYLRVDFDDENQTISRLIKAARIAAERVTHRALSTQTIQCINTVDQPTGGPMSGSISAGPSWYQYQEQLGANPFGASQFYFELPAPPIQSITTIETRVTVWEDWVPFVGVTSLDAVPEPARLYFQSPPTVNQWRFTYSAGYNSTRPIPEDLKQLIFSLIAFWYDHREGEPSIPAGIMDQLYSYKVDWV